MKSLILLFSGALFLLVFLLVGTACERHPISQTIPGYTEKQNDQQKEREEKRILPAAKPPLFFH